jgi:acyl-CoA synthetase (AMP-forming)/AMP-acid ligase II
VLLQDRLLTPLGRADLQVKVLGELVDLEAIEQELAAHSQGGLEPGRFVVLAVPDERAGHALVPVFDAALDPEIIAAALSAYEAEASGFRRLRAAVILEYFSRSSLGKPCRAEIAADVGRSW